MMVLAAALEVSGAFALVAWWTTRRASTPLRLLFLVSFASALLSAFLINDVVCLAFAPLVLRMAESLECDPKPHLLALATASNVGSVATITGNPQNILIGSLSGISYGRFALALAPIAFLSLLVNTACIWVVHRSALASPREACPVRERPRVYRRWVWKGTITAVAVIVAFTAGATPAIVALLGASAILLTRKVDPRRLYARIDWGLLALFASLFVVVAGVERAHWTERLFHWLEPLHPESTAGLTAVTALLSNVVSNVPAVMVLKSIVPHLARPRTAWLTLAMASTLAGNLTLPGLMATIIVVERVRGSVHIGWSDFLKVGVPSALASLAIGAAWIGLVSRSIGAPTPS